MSPLMSDLLITVTGIVPLLVLVVLFVRRECELTAAAKADPAE